MKCPCCPCRGPELISQHKFLELQLQGFPMPLLGLVNSYSLHTYRDTQKYIQMKVNLNIVSPKNMSVKLYFSAIQRKQNCYKENTKPTQFVVGRMKMRMTRCQTVDQTFAQHHSILENSSFSVYSTYLKSAVNVHAVSNVPNPLVPNVQT